MGARSDPDQLEVPEWATDPQRRQAPDDDTSSTGPGSRLPAGAGGVAEPSFALRVRALTRIRPVADLAAPGRWGDRMPEVDPIGLALAAVDLVISRQGLPEQVGYEEAADVLTRLAAIADPAAGAAAHRSIAEHVLDALLNKTGHQAKFAFPVGNWVTEPDLGYRRSLLEFWLLREREDRASGRLVLHADADAINALVAGLAFDVGDEQAAAELVLRRQIARGEFGKAEATAARNLQLTVRYAEDLDEVLVATRRDLRTAAPRWSREVPRTLQAARSHLTERLAEEDSLLEHLRTVTDPAPPVTAPGALAEGLAGALAGDRAELLAAAGRAARLLEKCRERHTELIRRVIEAINVFLDAQQSQAFRPPGSLRVPELGPEVLRPTLALPVGRAAAVGAAFLTALSVSPRPVIRLSDLLDSLLAPPHRPETGVRPDPDPSEPGQEAGAALAPELLAAAADAVRVTGLPARLSALLRTAARVEPERGADVGSLLASAALWLFAPDEAEQAGAAAAHELFGPGAMAATDGAALADRLPPDLPGGPWYGDDLLIAADEGALLDALAAPPSPTRAVEV